MNEERKLTLLLGSSGQVSTIDFKDVDFEVITKQCEAVYKKWVSEMVSELIESSFWKVRVVSYKGNVQVGTKLFDNTDLTEAIMFLNQEH